MAGRLSFGQIAAQVDQKCGEVDQTRLLSIMGDCLTEIFNQTCECPEYQVSGQLTVQPGVCDYPLTLNDGTKLRSISQVLNPDSCKTVECLTDKSERCDSGDRGTPSQFEIWGDTLTIYPTPDSACPLFIHGYRDVSCELYVDESDGEGGTKRTWQWIDLPEQLHGAYMNCVLGLTYAEQGDYQAADYWIRIASAAIDSFVEKKKRGPIKSTGILRTENFCHKPNPCCDDGCCEVHGEPTITMPDKARVDDCGNEVKPNYMSTLS